MSLPTYPTNKVHPRHVGAAAIVAGAALSLTACGGETGADPESTRSRVSSSIPGVVDNAAASFDLLSNSETLSALSQSFDSLGNTFGFGGEESEGNFRLFDGHEGFDEEMSGADVAEFLSEVIFTDENYEGDGYYRVPTDVLCPPDPFTGEADTECEELITAVEPRVRAVLAGDNGIDITIVIGPERLEPIGFELREASLAVVADFGEIMDVIEFLADVADEEIEGLPEVFEGVVAATLIVHGEEHVSVEAAVREAIRIEADGISASLAARDPMFSLEANGPEQSVTATVDVGPFNLQGPWAEMNEESNASGDFELDWQGFTAKVTLEEDAKALQIEDIGFGGDTSTMSLDGSVLFALDLNPDSGRTYTLTILPEEGEHPTFGFDPELDLSLAFGLQPLADAGDEVPDFLLDETYRVAVTGSQPTLQPVDASGEFTGGLRVVSGELAISTTGDDREVIVAEGSCLVEREPEEGDHPVLGALSDGACE